MLDSEPSRPPWYVAPADPAHRHIFPSREPEVAQWVSECELTAEAGSLRVDDSLPLCMACVMSAGGRAATQLGVEVHRAVR